MAAQAMAEAAQMTAEEAAMDAQAAQATAETQRDEAYRLQGMAETAKMVAEQAAADAMQAEMDAQAAQKVAEDALAAANQTAADNAAARDAALKAQMDAETARDNALKAQMDAETARDTALKAQMDAETARDTALKAQMDAETARDTALKAQMDAETARDSALKAQMDAEDKAAMYKRQLDALQGTVDTGDMADANAAAKALLTALMDSDPETPNAGNDSGLGAPHGTNAAAGVEVSSEGMLMVEVEGYSTSGTAPDMMIEGWRGVMLSRGNSDGTMDTAAVYTNIGDDGMASLLDRYTSTLPTAAASRSYLVGGTVGATSEVTDEAANATTIPWDEVMRPDDMTTASGPSTDPITMFKGSVHGIPGTFSCNAVDSGLCTAPQRYSDGTVNGATTGLPTSRAVAWSFVPDEGVPLYTDDPTYLTLGWWVDKDVAGNAEDFREFALATGLAAARTTANTLGSAERGAATYRGAAAGQYAIASATADSYEGGSFTAMATLMVDLDANLAATDGTNDRNGVALSGMIDNFLTGGTSRPDWSVKLMVDDNGTDGDAVMPLANLVPTLAGDAATDPRHMTEWSTGGAAKGTGSWTATFYGGTDTANIAGVPDAATGTFNANISDVARIRGAFGAMKE